jgi:predicted O-methyltransferase YrrM
MPNDQDAWSAVDEYVVHELVEEDADLVAARQSARHAGLPSHEVTPNQGKLLALLVEMTGARRVLEIGTLAGYSTIWLARAVGANGHVTTLESDAVHASLARKNFDRAGVAGRVNLIEGPAERSLEQLAEDGTEPFDLVFIDADKPNNPRYLALSLLLSRPGTVIVGDNVVRDGEIVDAASDDPKVQGVRTFLHDIAVNPLLDGTAIQTVGAKGWDGFSIAIVRAAE